MKCVLAVDTSGLLCSLAVYRDGEWLERTQRVERRHNQVVLAQLERLLTDAGIRRRQIEGVAFAAGPASFTGVRISAALAQGVAFACGARVLPVASSLALAAATTRHVGCDAAETRVLTVTRSRRDADYCALYQLTPGATPRCIEPDRLVVGASAADVTAALGFELAGASGVGDRPAWWPEHVPFIDDVSVDAGIVGRLALEPLQRGEGLPPDAALPIYVVGDHPWQPSAR